MPTYVYECEAGHTFEVEQRITAEPLVECTRTATPGSELACSHRCLRVLSAAHVVFKGNRWAKDGYK